MAFCGPNLALCGIIVSTWGVIQLIFMGFFYFMESLALSEDLPIGENLTPEQFLNDAEKAYTRNAHNCWIAACFYVLTLAVSIHQFYLNSHRSISM